MIAACAVVALLFTPSLARAQQSATAILKQVVIVSDLAAIQPEGVAPSNTPIDVRGPDFLQNPVFAAILTTHLGRTLTHDELTSLVKTIFDYCRLNGHSLVDVVVPEQAIDNGVMQIAVVQLKGGKVTISGNRWFSEQAIAHYIHVENGKVVDEQSMADSIAALNRSPYRHATIVYNRAGPDTTDVEVKVVDRMPFTAYAGFGTTGTQSLGSNQIFAGFDWGNVFGLDHDLSVQYLSSTDLLTGYPASPDLPNQPTLQAIQGSYTLPTFGNQRMSISGAYEEGVPTVDPNFSQTISDLQLSTRYVFPLPVRPNLSQEISTGVDYDRSDGQLKFTGILVSTTTTEVLQGALEYALKYDSPHKAGEVYSTTNLNLGLYLSPGGLTPDNTTEQFNLARQGAKADYAYLHARADHLAPLFGPVSWYVGGQAQVATGALLSNQKLWLGGFDTIRGYDENSASGDSGVLMRNELRIDLLNGGRGLIPAASSGFLGEQFVQLYGFWDIGWVKDLEQEFATPESVTLQSAGIGFRYQFLTNLSVQGDFGWQLRALPGQEKGQRGDVLAVISY